MEIDMKLMFVLIIGLSWTTTLTECVPTTTVTIENALSDHVSAVRIHCKSRDDDIGDQLLGPSGTYRFSFRPNAVRTSTLFFCAVSSIFGQASFEVYEEKRDMSERCTHSCRWEAQDGGVVGYNEKTSEIDIRIPWTT